MTLFSADDHQYMAQALRLAEQGLYTTMPNPRVGCVVVKDGKVIGTGAHLKAGEPHAEVHALRQAGAAAKGATAYVTLEPCSHTGRTPPCSQALIDAGVTTVIAAMQDPNPKVAGSGLAHLQAHGILVASGLMQAQAEALNPGFIARMTRQTPFVRSKIAASLDGKTALSNGVSQWITSEPARLDVQHWRARSCAILTGVGTVLADNPSMTVRSMPEARMGIGSQPMRIIVDSALKTPPNAKILQNGNTLIAFAASHPEKEAALLAAGAELLLIPNAQDKVCLNTLLSHLASCEINEVLVEGGQGLNGALLAQGLVDELLLYYAPTFMGGAANSMFAMTAFTDMQQAIALDIVEVRQVGVDIRVRAKPKYHAD
jgi:diaminohydroxyphosphoribosylaminopyrimidine deaminase / 5-amino-6-(5-phosphoribosylamino)uracil reductase